VAESRLNNPYAAPTARVQDVHNDSETQPIKLWSAQGRMGRLRWVGWSMLGSLAMLPVAFIGGLLGAASGSESVTYVLLGAVYIAYIVFYALLTIQRAHDLDWSGWLALIVLIPLVGLVFMVMRGTPGRNRFGAPPVANPRGMGWIVAVPLVTFVIGILAAVSLPAYQSYVMKARAAQTQGQ
jgi:uncharacterized membrane protein YhaH (DUF805 family)